MQPQTVLNHQQEQYRQHDARVLLALSIICIISLLLFIVPFALIFNLNDTPAGHSFLLQTESWMGTLPGTGILLLLAEAIVVMILDWRGAITLRGMLKKQTMHKGKVVDMGPGRAVLYVFFPEIMVPIYLLRATFDYFHTKHLCMQQEKHQQKFEMAGLQAKMGILPPTDGTCRMCKKPLIVGAEFCQYCGATVLERAKVCPSCSTIASPDAKWCPKCRTALS